MPLRRIGDVRETKPCRHPEHNPPMHIVLPDGVYEHECPSCHSRQIFTVEKPRFVTDGKHLFPADED